MGFLLKLNDSDEIGRLEEDSNWENGWDGLECIVDYNAAATDSVVFIGRDVYHKQASAPDYYKKLDEVLARDYLDV